MTRPFRASCLLAVGVIALSGCSYSQVFHLTLTVLDATDGTPVAGARVAVEVTSVSESRKDDPVPPETQLRTNDRGRLEHDLSFSDYTPTSSRYEKWYLKVRRDGYEPVVIDITPRPLPEFSKEKLPLTVKVEMRPEKKPAR